MFFFKKPKHKHAKKPIGPRSLYQLLHNYNETDNVNDKHNYRISLSKPGIHVHSFGRLKYTYMVLDSLFTTKQQLISTEPTN